MEEPLAGGVVGCQAQPRRAGHGDLGAPQERRVVEGVGVDGRVEAGGVLAGSDGGAHERADCGPPGLAGEHERDVGVDEAALRFAVVANVQFQVAVGVQAADQGHQDDRAGPCLGQPRGRDVVGGVRGDDPVVRLVLRAALGAVANNQAGPVAEGGEPFAVCVGQGGVVFDAGHVPVAEPGAEQGGGVAGAGADFEHVRVIRDVEVFEHPDDDAGEGGGAGGCTDGGAFVRRGGAVVELGDPGGVLVGQLQPALCVGVPADGGVAGDAVRAVLGDVERGQEDVPGHRQHRVPPLRAAQRAVMRQFLGESDAQAVRRFVGPAQGVRHVCCPSFSSSNSNVPRSAPASSQICSMALMNAAFVAMNATVASRVSLSGCSGRVLSAVTCFRPYGRVPRPSATGERRTAGERAGGVRRRRSARWLPGSPRSSSRSPPALPSRGR